jgi:glycosyltransferase involved in cell wall biosynthesis
MTKFRIVNLLDDFALGGVVNGLRLFDTPEFRSFARFETHAIESQAMVAPKVEADIILTHSPPNWRRISFFHSLRHRNPQARIIHVEHSYSKEWAALHVPEMRRFRAMMRLSLAAVDAVVAVSTMQKQWLEEEEMVRPGLTRVIHPFGNTPNLSSVPDIFLDPKGPLIIGAYGRFCEAKGFDQLITAFRQTGQADNLRLLIGGYGPDEAALQDLAIGDDRILFVGKVGNVAGFLAQCHIIAVPSRYETYGQVAHEARQAGRPILVSTAGGLPEQVGDAGLIVDCDDPNMLFNALQSLHQQPLAEMGRAGRAATHGALGNRTNLWRRLFEEQGKKAELSVKRQAKNFGDPYGNRTRVSAVKGPRPNR